MEAFVYRPRRPIETPLYKLFESLYERVKGCWEERFDGEQAGTLKGGPPRTKPTSRREELFRVSFAAGSSSRLVRVVGVAPP